jgi:peptidoglycan/LPS O-acetylase OafA/YrhL
MQNTVTDSLEDKSGKKSTRLYYLDWLRVLALLGVFLFHAVHPFDMFAWEIKNAEQSIAVTLFIVFLGPWGMPLFFFVSGATSWFALRPRTGRQFVNERVKRLLIPFIIGCLLLSPIQLYFQWNHQLQTGLFEGSLFEFLKQREISFGPQVFGWAGYHLWFLGFLFAYSLIALPLFQWLKKDNGRRFIEWLGRIVERRGGILLFIIPLILIQFVLRPYFPHEHDWADFIFTLGVFILGFIFYSDERFTHAIRRDWPLMLILGILSTLFFFTAGALDLAVEWMEASDTPGFYLLWSMWAINSWCWTIFMLYIGMRYLNFINNWLKYGQETILPFYLLHQPVIIIIAYYVVQWNASITLKLLAVVVGSLLVTLGLIEILIKRINFLRKLFGLKPRDPSLITTS